MPRYRRRLLWCSLFTGCIALFPQALVPLLMKLSGGHARVWFLALYLPGAWQWPVITLMFLLGLASLALAARIWITPPRSQCSPVIAGAAVAGPVPAHPFTGKEHHCAIPPDTATPQGWNRDNRCDATRIIAITGPHQGPTENGDPRQIDLPSAPG